MCYTTKKMHKYTKNRGMLTYTIDAKYRIYQILQTYEDENAQEIVLGNLIMTLGLSYEQLRKKLFARLGEEGPVYSFSSTEMQTVLREMNRLRPFRRPLRLSQLYHPAAKLTEGKEH